MRTDQASKRADGHAHFHKGSHVLLALGAHGEGGRCPGDNGARSEIKYDRIDTKRCATYSLVRAEDNDPRGDGLKGVKVESSALVGRDTRDDTAKRRRGAKDSEQVFRREYEEEQSEHTNEDEEQRCDTENASGVLASGRDIKVRGSRGQTGLNDHAGVDERHHEEACDVYRPPEAGVVEQRGQSNGDNDIANRGSGNHHSPCGCSLLVKLFEYCTHFDAHQHPLDEHYLPVLVTKAQQHDAQQVKNGGGVDNLIMMGICAYQKRFEDRDEEHLWQPNWSNSE